MATYMVYMLGKEIVYTASLATARKLEAEGFTRILYVDGRITSAHLTAQPGKDWEACRNNAPANPSGRN